MPSQTWNGPFSLTQTYIHRRVVLSQARRALAWSTVTLSSRCRQRSSQAPGCTPRVTMKRVAVVSTWPATTRYQLSLPRSRNSGAQVRPPGAEYPARHQCMDTARRGNRIRRACRVGMRALQDLDGEVALYCHGTAPHALRPGTPASFSPPESARSGLTTRNPAAGYRDGARVPAIVTPSTRR